MYGLRCESFRLAPPTAAIPVIVVTGPRRALLARKRRRTPNGARVMLGAALIDPWAPVLASHGVEMSCLTSRTLNRVAQAAVVTRVERSGRQ